MWVNPTETEAPLQAVEQAFPESEETVQATIARVLDLKGNAGDAQLVRMSSVSIVHAEHDNWNGGTDFYTLRLRLPLEVFLQMESDLASHEGRLLGVAQSVWRDFESDVISTVQILPDRSGRGTGGFDPAPSQIPPFWNEACFRLFLSHCNSRRAETAQLRGHLALFGVSGFVAHEDIEPSALWQAEIEKALRTCEALVAIITDDFASSLWCDQEVGFALGRGVPALPIQCGKAPHGFIAKTQALGIRKGQTLASCAPQIVGLLLRSPQTSMSMTNALVLALADSASFAQSKAVAASLESAPSLTAAHGTTLRAALRTNDQVADAFGVPERIDRLLESHRI